MEIIKKQKRTYVTPMIERIVLDNEISLQLESTPPTDPPLFLQNNNAPDYFNNDPFKTDVG